MDHIAANTLPAIYRSEAFVEDLDPLLQADDDDAPCSRFDGWQRFAGWLLAVPGTVAVLAAAVVIATLPG